MEHWHRGGQALLNEISSTRLPASQLAVWSMITGIIATVLGIIGACGVIVGPVAIALSVPARRQIEESRGWVKGSGMAKAGLTTGIIGSSLSVMWIVLFATGVMDLNNLGTN